jgi:hypothetical protein
MRIITIFAIFGVVGCTAPGAQQPPLTKAEAEALGGKSDGVDWCDWMGWYGDGVCDPWCPLADHDCSDDECTVGADSTCADGEYCMPGVCLAYCVVGDPSCCAPATCQGGADFCPTALCAPGTYCNEETDSCEPVVCGEVLCALYCPYGFEVDEDGCEICRCADEPGFCLRALCGPGTVCDEATDSCVPAPADCIVSGCSGEICADESRYSTCIARPEAVCYADYGVCERQPSGACGWSSTPDFDACMASFP